MRIAIIPTRRGSERAPGKNTARIGGLTLVERALQQALRTGIFDQVVVSTNDPEVVELVKGQPVILDNRDAELASEYAPLIAVIANIVHKYDLPEDAIVTLLVVTNPLRSDKDICEAVRQFEASDRQHTLVSVCEMDHPIEMTWRIGEDGLMYPTFATKTTRKQDFAQTYRWNDAMVIDTTVNFCREGRTLYGDSPRPFMMPPERSLYIDYPWQLRLIKLLVESDRERE